MIKKPKQLYFKMFWTYTAIVFCIVSALVGYFISVSRRRLLESNQEEIKRISYEAADYIESAGQIADAIHTDLYRSSSELDDLLAYFRLGPEEYQNYSLDRYIASDGVSYRGFFNLIAKEFEANKKILEKIELISYETFEMTECYPDKSTYPGKDGRAKLEEIGNHGLGENGKLTWQKEIRNPATGELAGCMLFTFEGEKAFQKMQNSNPYAKMKVTQGNDVTVYRNPEEIPAFSEQEDTYFVEKESVDDYQITVYMDEAQAASMPVARFLAILAAGVAAVVVGIIYIDFYVKRLTRRVDSILDAMNQVTTGNFQIRLETGKDKDELDMIADNFNSMCEKLELYIEKSYLEEIERKNAQMQALQSQINPHFLYNTLEVIRMKAICNGDREVGKMLYSMVTLFRSQLKEADVITLGQELDYCKQYLELFEYRYQGSFHSRVECPVGLLSIPIIKFVLQPIIENYFIHGIERNRQDNEVYIRAEKKEDTLFLYVQDNGCGMEQAEMDRKNRELRENVKIGEKKKSIGIHNVNRRIKAVYGEKYGITMKAAEPKGLLVTLTIRIEEGETHEKGNVG